MDEKKTDTNWHNDFGLYVKRNSNGNNNPPLSGGTTYQLVTDSDLLFFTGKKSPTAIDIQLKIDNVSVQIPPDTYTTTVVYTATET